eukprot:1006119-Rhodomonas_salina.2
MANLPSDDRSVAHQSSSPDDKLATKLDAETPGTVQAPKKSDGLSHLKHDREQDNSDPPGTIPMTSLSASNNSGSMYAHSSSNDTQARMSSKTTPAPDRGTDDKVPFEQMRLPVEHSRSPAKDASSDEGRESCISLARLVDPYDDNADVEEKKSSIDEDFSRGEPAKLAARSGKLNEDARYVPNSAARNTRQ